MMRHLAICLAFCVASPASAEDQEGVDLMGEALRLFMKGLMQEMDPAIEGIEGLLDDFSGYHPPEVLPNGDIIIRKRQPDEPQIGEGGDVEL